MCDVGAVQHTPRDQDHPWVKVCAVRLVTVEPPPLLNDSTVVNTYSLLAGLVKAALSSTLQRKTKGWRRKGLLEGLCHRP